MPFLLFDAIKKIELLAWVMVSFFYSLPDSPVVTIYTASFKSKSSAFFPHRLFMRSVSTAQYRAIINIYTSC